MPTALAPVGADLAPLASMSLADAPDHRTAIAAGMAHGLTAPEALKSSFGKWLRENAADVEAFGLGSFYDGTDQSRAFVNNTRLLHFLVIVVADQARAIDRLTAHTALPSSTD